MFCAISLGDARVATACAVSHSHAPDASRVGTADDDYAPGTSWRDRWVLGATLYADALATGGGVDRELRREARADLSVGYRFGRRFDAQVAVPWVTVWLTDESGQQIRAMAIGDVELQLGAVVWQGGEASEHTLRASVGVRAPSAPEVLVGKVPVSDNGQIGAGSWVLSGGLQWSTSWHRVTLRVGALGRWVAAARWSWTPGDSLAMRAGLDVRLADGPVSLTADARTTWTGVTVDQEGAPEADTGGWLVTADLGAQWRINQDTTLGALVSLPAVNALQGVQRPYVGGGLWVLWRPQRAERRAGH